MNPRITLRMAADRRRLAAGDSSCPQLLRVRSHAERVLCDTDLHAKPLIPRKYRDAAVAIASAAIVLATILMLAFLGGLQ